MSTVESSIYIEKAVSSFDPLAMNCYIVSTNVDDGRSMYNYYLLYDDLVCTPEKR